MASSSLRPRHITVFVFGASTPPLFGASLRASGFMRGYLCIGYLDSYDDHDYLRTASLTMAIHPRLGFLDIGTKGYHPHEGLPVFLQSQHSYYTDVMSAGGCQSVGFYLQLLLHSHRLQCSRYDCGGYYSIFGIFGISL